MFNFLLIIIYGYVIVATLLSYFILRDRKKTNLFFGKWRRLGLLIVMTLLFGNTVAIYSTIIEPFILITKYETIKLHNIEEKIKIAFVSDMQVGEHKKMQWMEKIVAKIKLAKPDIVIIGGDLIANEGTTIDESKFLEPIKKLTTDFPVFYILGNHEYGIGGAIRNNPSKYNDDKSQLVIDRMNSYGAILLQNTLKCPKIKDTQICLYGIDEIWKYNPDFSSLENWNKNIPLIFITHNPDGILYYPTNLQPPDLVLAGHTHGGQVWIPFYGYIISAQTILSKHYYRGLNYWNNIPIYTSKGAGESNTNLRLFAVPEVVILEINKKTH